MTGKNVAHDETIMMTKRAEILAPSWPLYSLPELARAQMTSRGSAVLRSTLLALKAGVPDPLEDMVSWLKRLRSRWGPCCVTVALWYVGTPQLLGWRDPADEVKGGESEWICVRQKALESYWAQTSPLAKSALCFLYWHWRSDFEDLKWLVRFGRIEDLGRSTITTYWLAPKEPTLARHLWSIGRDSRRSC